jgi:3-hydroxybutyryl-CoA dehydrogenase
MGMHWFNPPEWTPGVEVVPTGDTDRGAVERVLEFLRALGKRPAVVRPSTGFVANRLQMALFCEASRCVEEGLASPAEIDEVVRSCFGFRLPFFGPFQIADMAGLDVYKAVMEEHIRGLGERYYVPERLRELVADGRTGTSSGAGYYAYDGDVARERDARYAALDELTERLPPQTFKEP